jgi:hypothetical protein
MASSRFPKLQAGQFIEASGRSDPVPHHAHDPEPDTRSRRSAHPQSTSPPCREGRLDGRPNGVAEGQASRSPVQSRSTKTPYGRISMSSSVRRGLGSSDTTKRRLTWSDPAATRAGRGGGRTAPPPRPWPPRLRHIVDDEVNFRACGWDHETRRGVGRRRRQAQQARDHRFRSS